MSYREAHQEGMFAAAQLHHDLEIDTSKQIDVFTSIDNLGLRLLFRPLDGCAGAYLSASSSAGILVNVRHPLALQRLTAAHELGHHVFRHGVTFDRVLPDPAIARKSREELLAEAFASWFLMPPELVDSALNDLQISQLRSAEDAYALSLHLGTSYLATCYHLVSLRLIEWVEARDWATLSPRNIKRKVIPSLEELRADVWTVDVTRSWPMLTVKRGDYLVVRRMPAATRFRLTSSQGEAWSPQIQLDAGGQLDLFGNSTDGAVAIRVPDDLSSGLWRLVAEPTEVGLPQIDIALSVTSPRQEGLYLRNDYLELI